MDARLKIENVKRQNGTRNSLGDEGKISIKHEVSQKPAPGTVLWILLPKRSWWPAQVVENYHGSGLKKSKRGKGGKVLARLYGSNELLYVDPKQFLCDFENELKQNSFSFSEILQKSLKEDLAQKKSGQSQRDACVSEGCAVVENESKFCAENKSLSSKKQTKEWRGQNEKSGSQPPEKSPLSSSRRMKVMQMLGLMAPSASPFRKNGFHVQ